MKKAALLIPDFFWSSIPYDGLVLYEHLSKSLNIDLIMFSRDIRLKKTHFSFRDKFKFISKKFYNKKLIRITNWKDLFTKSKQYDLLISTVHLSPKHRNPELKIKKTFKEELQCPLMVIDIGGTDILVSALARGTYFCVKGPIWKEWLAKKGIPEKNIFITGTPQYDNYFDSDLIPNYAKPISDDIFRKKYGIKNKILLLAPCNPASHLDQFNKNLEVIKKLEKLCIDKKYHLLIKTYPHDYVYYERDHDYSGIYRRTYSKDEPQYSFLEKRIPTAKIIESQDHFSALKSADLLFNMSGSHIAWETYFTKTQSYSMNYKNQSYYGSASYLPDFVKLPDDYVNIHINNIEEIFSGQVNDKEKCDNYFINEISLNNIKNAVTQLMND